MEVSGIESLLDGLGRVRPRPLWGALAAAALFTLLTVPATAEAVLSGPNGRIVFVSGRDGGDAQAKIYLRTIVGSAGGGSAGEPIAAAAGQHRHPTWSPDRTKIAYARGDSGCATNCDIYVLDITSPGSAPENITSSATVTEDRPAWSPDGTRIAFESEVANGSGQTDVLVKAVDSAAAPLNLTSTPAAYEGKPAWTPDSATIFYHRGNPAVAGAMDILRRPAAGGPAADVAAAPGISEFQPSISPDGAEMCFTRGDFANANATQLIVSLANGGGQTPLAVNDPAAADYNCTWSPDGTKLAWVQGAFGNGALVMANSDNSSPSPVTLENPAPASFDGNPDWAPDGQPACEAVTVETDFDSSVTVPLVCADTGPAYEQTGVTENITGQPTSGTLGAIAQGSPTTEPSSIVYTPTPGFSGTDSFEFNGFGGGGFATPVTATINVGEPPDVVPPELVLTGKKKQKLGRAVALKARCNEACDASATGKLKVRFKRGGGVVRKSFALRPAGKALPAGERRKLKLKLPKRARRIGKRALGADGRVRAKLKVTADDAADNRSRGKRTVELRPRKRR